MPEIFHARQSWLNTDKNSDFSIYNIPFGIAKIKDHFEAVSAIGDQVILIKSLHQLNCFEGLQLPIDALTNRYLNDFIALGKSTTSAVRNRIQMIFDIADSYNIASKSAQFLIPITEVEMMLPIQIGDYTDFYSSREHATNVGTMFRDPANALLPNWLHLPVGYHGRSSSIIPSGIPFKRPKGQQMPVEGQPPVFGPTKQLDFELEMGFVIGKGNNMGDQIAIDDAESHIFGLMLFNDWSARDLQKWEYVPLGPFLAKNFASTISPWIVSLEALNAFKVQGPEPTVALLPYLQQTEANNYNIELEVYIQPESQAPHKICHSNTKFLYWSMAQQLAHHTVNGCNMRVGDLCASGTISGPSPDSYGSMLEIAWKGTKPVALPDGTTRNFIADGDTVIMKAWAESPDGHKIGFGDCSAKILPSN